MSPTVLVIGIALAIIGIVLAARLPAARPTNRKDF